MKKIFLIIAYSRLDYEINNEIIGIYTTKKECIKQLNIIQEYQKKDSEINYIIKTYNLNEIIKDNYIIIKDL